MYTVNSVSDSCQRNKFLLCSFVDCAFFYVFSMAFNRRNISAYVLLPLSEHTSIYIRETNQTS